MDISKIKNLVKSSGDKFIFVENGEPEVVVMSFAEYEKLTQSRSNVKIHQNDSNHSGDELGSFEPPSGFKETEFLAPVVAESIGLPVRLEDIRLEDLPI